jgi:hypothetical protein
VTQRAFGIAGTDGKHADVLNAQCGRHFRRQEQNGAASEGRAINERATVAVVSGAGRPSSNTTNSSPPTRVGLPEFAPEPSSDGYEQFVTRRMTESIVDVFEVVEIPKEHCTDDRRSARSGASGSADQ